jgi:predicted ribosome quality control (RQC) complex YloA/Tae2 family protein
MKNIKGFRKYFEGSKKEKFPDIKKVEIEGFVVYMGRDAKSNDHLTFNVADEEDIWMHAKGVPGSHLVIRVRENLPTEEVIKKAAEIAKKNSKGKDKEGLPIVYCQRRFVKKDPGMNDGQVKVDYINAHEITI